MKNFRFLILILIFVTVISSLLFFLKREKIHSSAFYSENELLELEKEHNKWGELLSESSAKKQNYIKNKQGSDSAGIIDDITENSDTDNSISSGSTNEFSENKLALNDGTQISDSLNNKDNTSKKNSSTNSQNSLKSLQEILDELPSRSNDFIVRLDKNIDGLETTVSGREARVSARLLNSDLFNNSIFSNSPGVWITGLSKYKDASIYSGLEYDYQNRFLDIPGYGIYIMKDELSDEHFSARKIEILNELINKNNDDQLYETLADSFAESGDMDAASETIDKWARQNNKINYDYEMAEINRINGENSDNDETSRKYLLEATRYYEQSGAGFKVALPLAKTYEKLGDINSAIRTLENSYDYGKSKQWQDDVAVQLGNYYSKNGDDYAALEWYGKSPKPEFINNVRCAETYQRLGDSHSAIEYYEKSIKYNERANYIPMLSLGIIYCDKGNEVETTRIYNKINNRIKNFPSKRKKNIKNSSAYQKIKKASLN